MKPVIPTALLAEAAEWADLHRWECKQLGMALRRLGLTYSEIQSVIPVPKGTLSNWSRNVTLTDTQIAAIRDRTGPNTQRGIPRDTQRKRRREIGFIRSEAHRFAESNLCDPHFVGGVVLYWGEGSKTQNSLDLSNADPAALRTFIRWVRRYLDADAEFVLSMHLHEGNDEPAARKYWASAVGMPGVGFTKTFIKPLGTGHRKNYLKHGVCRVRVRRAADHWHRTMVWIQVVAESLGPIEDPCC